MAPTQQARRIAAFAPLGAALAAIGLDQLLKHWADGHLRIFQRVPLLGQSWLVLSRVLNRGLMGDRYSAIPNGYIEPYTRYFPTAVWGIIAGLMLTRFRRDLAPAAERWGFSLLLAGGISNLMSHWMAETVVDPLQIYMGAEEYLPFNLADVAIVAGMGLVVYSLASELLRPAREVTSGTRRSVSRESAR